MLVIPFITSIITHMELEQAIDMVSYKIGLRFGEPAAADPLFSKWLPPRWFQQNDHVSSKLVMKSSLWTISQKTMLSPQNQVFNTLSLSLAQVTYLKPAILFRYTTQVSSLMAWYGWTEALQLMPVGAKYQLFIPQDLGYADRGVGSDIPPYATLIFDVELLAIEKD